MEEGQSFEEFAMRCARNFGALSCMRDQPLDDPIPDRFPPSEWHAQRVHEAKAKLEKLSAMSEQEKVSLGESLKADQVRGCEERLARDVEQNKRLEEMRVNVLAWIPPTEAHGGLKKFMLEQLDLSKEDVAFSEGQRQSAAQKAAIVFFAEAVQEANHAIEWNLKEHAKEVLRNLERNSWIDRLRESLKTTTKTTP